MLEIFFIPLKKMALRIFFWTSSPLSHIMSCRYCWWSMPQTSSASVTRMQGPSMDGGAFSHQFGPALPVFLPLKLGRCECLLCIMLGFWSFCSIFCGGPLTSNQNKPATPPVSSSALLRTMWVANGRPFLPLRPWFPRAWCWSPHEIQKPFD